MSDLGQRGEMVECSRVLVAAAEQAGVDVARILAELGLLRTVLDDPEQRVHVEVCDRLWARLQAECSDPDLPLRAVELSPFGNFLVIDFLGANGGTLGGGMRALARYFHVVHPHIQMTAEADGPLWKVAFSGPQESGDFALAMTLSRFSTLLTGLVPLRTCLVRGPARDLQLARRLFGPHIEWRGAEDAAWFDHAAWQTPLPHSNPALLRVLERHADAHGPAEVPALPDRVAGVVRQLLPQGDADIQRVAPRIGLSVRTLQRRLTEAGQPFQLIAEAERRRAAERHLANPALTLVEVALMVGYADETAFHRAFQRWHGTSPSRWRRGQQAA